MEGFGINTNVLETNVLNLAVVIVVLFIVGKDVLTSLLDERRQKIVQSLDDVEARYQKAQKRLDEAKEELVSARVKAKEIRTQSTTTASQSFALAEKRAEDEITRLEGTKTSTIAVEKQKLIGEMRELLTSGAFEKAFTALKQDRSGITVQKQFIDNLLNDVFSENFVFTE